MLDEGSDNKIQSNSDHMYTDSPNQFHPRKEIRKFKIEQNCAVGISNIMAESYHAIEAHVVATELRVRAKVTEELEEDAIIFDEQELEKIDKVCKSMMSERFDPNDQFYALQRQDVSFTKYLVMLHLLLERQNCLMKTPLHVAADNHQDKAVK